MDHYEVLGVPPDAEVAEIRRAYLAAARLHHPDFHAGESDAARHGHSTQMKAITEAWHVLGDLSRRADYDDRLRRLSAGPAPSERDRSHLRTDVPPGKGWTPRAGDDGWVDDFGAWANERDRLLPDEDEAVPGKRNVGGVIAVGLFVLSVLTGFLAMVFESRELLAAAFAGVVISSVSFIVLPLLSMTRHRPKSEAPSATKTRTPFSGGARQ